MYTYHVHVCTYYDYSVTALAAVYAFLQSIVEPQFFSFSMYTCTLSFK